MYLIKPTNRESAADLKAAATGIPCTITIGQPRRRDRNAAWWSAIQFYRENAPEWCQLHKMSKEAIHAAVQIEIGHTIMYRNDAGQIVQLPFGTGFDKIPDEIEYTKRFFEPAMDYLARRMGYIDRKEMQEAIREWTQI